MQLLPCVQRRWVVLRCSREGVVLFTAPFADLEHDTALFLSFHKT